MTDAVPLIVQGRDSADAAALLEIHATPVDGGTQSALWTLMHGVYNGVPQPVKLNSDYSIAMAPRAVEIIDTFAGVTGTASTDTVLLAAISILDYAGFSGYVVANKAYTLTVRYGFNSSLTAGQVTEVAVSAASGEDVQISIARHLGSYVEIEFTNAEGTDATVYGILLGVPA